MLVQYQCQYSFRINFSQCHYQCSETMILEQILILCFLYYNILYYLNCSWHDSLSYLISLKKYHCICGMDKYGQVTTGSLSKNLHRHLPPCCPTAVGYWKWILANSLSSTSVRILRLPVSGSLGQPFCKLCDPVRCDSAIRSPASKTENGNATPLQYGTTSVSNMT